MTRKQILCNLEDENKVIPENMLETTDIACHFYFLTLLKWILLLFWGADLEQAEGFFHFYLMGQDFP